jgi:hypothetical protein
MKRQQRFWTGIALAAALVSGTPSWAEKCGILALGGSTRFSQPVESIGDLLDSDTGQLAFDPLNALPSERPGPPCSHLSPP